MTALLLAFAKGEEGATLVEYALVTSILSVGCIGALTSIGFNVNHVFTQAVNGLVTFETGNPP